MSLCARGISISSSAKRSAILWCSSVFCDNHLVHICQNHAYPEVQTVSAKPQKVDARYRKTSDMVQSLGNFEENILYAASARTIRDTHIYNRSADLSATGPIRHRTRNKVSIRHNHLLTTKCFYCRGSHRNRFLRSPSARQTQSSLLRCLGAHSAELFLICSFERYFGDQSLCPRKRAENNSQRCEIETTGVCCQQYRAH